MSCSKRAKVSHRHAFHSRCQFSYDVALDAEAAVVPIVTGAFIALEALFIAVPNFIGAQIDNVLAAVLSPRLFLLTEEKTGDAAKARASLLSTAAKKLPAKSIFPAIIRQHAAITGTEKQVYSPERSRIDAIALMFIPVRLAIHRPSRRADSSSASRQVSRHRGQLSLHLQIVLVRI